MKLLNSPSSYGGISILLHWVMAVLIIAMYFLGEYMVDLDYYDQWYHQAPWWHKSIGSTLFILLILRVGFRASRPQVLPLPSYKSWEKVLAKTTHFAFYVAIFLVCTSGYFIGTAKGAPVEVFAWFEIPAIMSLTEDQTDFASEVHEVSVKVILLMLFFHVAAALKHHFFDRDSTLIRMFGGKK